MSKKKQTNKERDEAIAGLSNNDQILMKEIVEMKQLFSLNLEYREKVFNESFEDFNKFVKAKVKEFENKQRSEIKEGA